MFGWTAGPAFQKMDHERFCRFAGTCTPQQSQPIWPKTAARFIGQAGQAGRAWEQTLPASASCSALPRYSATRREWGGSVTKRGVSAFHFAPRQPGAEALTACGLQSAARRNPTSVCLSVPQPPSDLDLTCSSCPDRDPDFGLYHSGQPFFSSNTIQNGVSTRRLSQ